MSAGKRILAIALLVLWACQRAICAEPRLLDVRMIWDSAPHNAFTDLTRFNNRWLCTFREGSAHVSNDGAVRVLASDDAREWKPTALLHAGGGEDLRECKFAQLPDGRLMLIGAACVVSSGKRGTHQSCVWTSRDGVDWIGPTKVGDKDFWMWRAAWAPDGNGYSFGYATTEPSFLRLYRSTDPTRWEMLTDKILIGRGDPNETGLIFRKDGSAVCLVRVDGKTRTSMLGTSSPPYEKWEWKDLAVQIGGAGAD